MSVSNHINTDNHCPQSQIPQSPVEEIKKWRCTKPCKGEQHDLAVVSPQQKTSGEGRLSRLSEDEEITPKKCANKFLSSSPHPRICRAVFVRLAEESPKRNYDEFSDSSTYDSLNFRETDICHDSSDTESNSSFSSGSIGATIKVVEYEVASASNSEDLFTNDSSSGTDDILLATVARVICQSSKCSSDFADTEEDSSDSTSTYDSELSSADYWMCVKCKNKNNNPMFRYCEKCYQIRKTHFPPRPRLRKSRSAVKRNKSTLGSRAINRSATTSDIGHRLNTTGEGKDDAPKKDNSLFSVSSGPCLQNGSVSSPGRLLVGISQNQFNSAATSSSDDDDDNTTNQFYKVMNGGAPNGNDIEKTLYSKYFCSSGLTSNLNDQKSKTPLKRKLPATVQSKCKPFAKQICHEKDGVRPYGPADSEYESYSISSQSIRDLDVKTKNQFCKLTNGASNGISNENRENTAVTHFSPSDSETEIYSVSSQSICGSGQGTQKDSGFSSAPSSQETKSLGDQQNDDDKDNHSESADTVCDDINDSDVAEMVGEKDCISSALGLTSRADFFLNKRASDVSLESLERPTTALPLLKSMSECSDAYTNVKASSSNSDLVKFSSINRSNLNSVQLTRNGIVENDCDMYGYGSCMTCLTQPKNGVFVHSKFLHLCCCYKCAVKIWNKNKKCPVCNCVVKNVMKLFVH